MALALNFASSFLPERRYLSKMLLYIDRNRKRSSIAEIAESTGIPNGASSGKVMPTIYYLLGMGIIIENDDKWYDITPFGRAVFENDILFAQKVTQIACHFNICDSVRGAISYNQLFSNIKGNSIYTKEVIAKLFGSKVGDAPFSAMVSMYSKPESFSKVRILDFEMDGTVIVNPIPQYKELLPLLGALLITEQHRSFPNNQQVTIDEFETKTHFSKYFCWRSADMDNLLNQLASMNYVKIDANLTPVVFTTLMGEDEVWAEIYSQVV